MKKQLLIPLIAIFLICSISLVPALTWTRPAGAGGTSDHSALTNLNWANAGHTFDDNLNLSGYNITFVFAIFGNDTYVSIGGASTTHATFVGHPDTLVAEHLMSKGQAILYGAKLPTNNAIHLGDVTNAKLSHCTEGICADSIYLWINENLSFVINATNISLAGEMFVNETHKVCTSENEECKETVTKEFFIPVDWGEGGARQGSTGDFHNWNLPIDVGNDAHISFYIPADFTSVTSAVVVVIIGGMADPATIIYQIDTDFGAVGENYATHSTTIAFAPLMTSSGNIEELAITTTAMSAGDYVGVEISNLGTTMGGNVDFDVIGVRFKYT